MISPRFSLAAPGCLPGVRFGERACASQTKLPAEHLGHKAVASAFGRDHLANTIPHVRGASLALTGRQRRTICVPDVGARDLVAVTLYEPVKREQPRADGERGLLVDVVARGPGERPRIARRAPRKRERLIVEARVLRRREPLALITGVVFTRSARISPTALWGYFFVTARNAARYVPPWFERAP